MRNTLRDTDHQEIRDELNIAQYNRSKKRFIQRWMLKVAEICLIVGDLCHATTSLDR